MPESKATSAGSRLTFLDGIRALAALYVVLDHHVSDMGATIPRTLQHLTAWMGFGHYAVDVFIVLSGYCLMLPIARKGAGELPGGMREYFRRRSLRILPPYFAALILSLAGIWLLDEPAHITKWDVISHLLVIHNFSPNWVWSINPPLWSVAVEWQIYFAFPLILLPVWRKFGAAACIAVGLGLGMLPHFALRPAMNLDWSFPWYLGLFSMGMVAAVQSHRKMSETADRMLRRLCGVTLLVAFAIVVFSTYRNNSLYLHLYLIDMLLGAASAAGLIWCGRHCAAAHHPLALRMLNFKPLVTLGGMSFSLYLIHVPVWLAIAPIVRHFSVSPAHELAIRLMIGVPVAILVSYLFYLLIERPCMVHRNRRPAVPPPEIPLPLAHHAHTPIDEKTAAVAG